MFSPKFNNIQVEVNDFRQKNKNYSARLRCTWLLIDDEIKNWNPKNLCGVIINARIWQHRKINDNTEKTCVLLILNIFRNDIYGTWGSFSKLVTSSI